MGILTNPNSEETNRISTFLQRYDWRLSLLAYFGGIFWIILLAHTQYNLGTYFSENALLPGLVQEHFPNGAKADFYMKWLNDTNRESGQQLPVQELLSIFRNFGFDEVETQNFTLFDAVSNKKSFEGTNLYAILRAQRAAGTESLVLNVPVYRDRQYRQNVPSLAILLALAEYFREQIYWAKDIVLLISDGEIGSLAWVRGHQHLLEESSLLQFENVHAKAGNIQAVVNLVMVSDNICSLYTRYNGINGQLPNLDLANLMNKFIAAEVDHRNVWGKNIWRLFAFMKAQAFGSPDGDHGFFLKYGIESVTLVGKGNRNCKTTRIISFTDLGRVLEGTFRSLNNLLERLHQSFFFYFKTTPTRFISIGLYFPPLAMILFPIVLKGTTCWLSKSKNLLKALYFLTFVHSLAFLCRWTLSNLQFLTDPTGSNSDFLCQIVLFLIFIQSLCSLLFSIKADEDTINGIYCLTLLEYSTSLYSFALFNPSLVYFVGILSSPVFTLLFKWTPKRRKIPIFLFSVFIIPLVSYKYELLVNLVSKHFMESELYGNYCFDFFFIIAIPCFLSLVNII